MPGSQPLQDFASDSNGGGATLVGGACYSLTSAFGTPSLLVPHGPPTGRNITWAPAASAVSPQLPVLDLCNQVQSKGWAYGGKSLARGGLQGGGGAGAASHLFVLVALFILIMF